MAFAMKMWNWTRMGARVIVTPGEITPANFSHPLLVAQKVVPQPSSPMSRSRRARGEGRQGRGRRFSDQANGCRVLRIRKRASNSGRPSATPPLRDQTHTADASIAMPAIKPS